MNNELSKTRRNFLLLGIFSVAMGFLEAIVVVYIRQIYYPEGFNFPLNLLSPDMFKIEWLREISTIIMLVSISFIAGNNYLQKFSYFLFSFAIWDIFYYVGLKLFLNWPPSFLTWDILFLIPLPWIGPVLAPIISSFTMIFLAVCLIYFQTQHTIKIKIFEWSLIFIGAFVIFITFIWDYAGIIIKGNFLSSFWSLSNNSHFRNIISQYKPDYYNWYLFFFGEILILIAIVLIFKHAKLSRRNNG